MVIRFADDLVDVKTECPAAESSASGRKRAVGRAKRIWAKRSTPPASSGKESKHDDDLAVPHHAISQFPCLSRSLSRHQFGCNILLWNSPRMWLKYAIESSKTGTALIFSFIL